MPSTLKPQVLFDRAGVAYAVEGSARFMARGSGADAQVMLVSKGQFVFEKTDGGLAIVVSFSVKRNDQEQAEPEASAAAAPSPSEAEAS